MHHRDFYAVDGLRAALVHLEKLFHALLLEPAAEFGDADDFWIVLLRNFDRVADVVTMSMRNEHEIDFLDLFFARRRLEVVHDPRIDVDGLAFGRLNAKCSVSDPSKF